jgi:hypothetical protein
MPSTMTTNRLRTPISRKSLPSSKLSDSLVSSNKSKGNKQVTPPNSSSATPKRKNKKDRATSPPHDTTPSRNSSKSIRKPIISELSPVRRKSISSPTSQPRIPSNSTKGPRSVIASEPSPASRRKSVKAPDLQKSICCTRMPGLKLRLTIGDTVGCQQRLKFDSF